MSDEFAYLPALLAEIAEVAGLPAALKIAAERGGREVYFPEKAGDKHWLVACVGREAADALARRFGGNTVLVPLGGQRFYKRAANMAARLLDEGQSRAKVASLVGVHIRTVARVRAKLREEGDLFSAQDAGKVTRRR